MASTAISSAKIDLQDTIGREISLINLMVTKLCVDDGQPRPIF